MDTRQIVRAGYDKVSYAYRREGQTDGDHVGDYETWMGRLLAALGAEARVLDLGCGCGVPVAQTLARHARVTGVDLSPVQIERARARVPEAEFICADMATLVFPPGSFDAVLALYSIIHLPVAEQPALLAKIAGWLKPGGLFLATLGSAAWTGTEQDWLGVGGAEMYWSHADAPSYRRWLADAGFELLHDEFIPEGQGGGGHQLFHARIRPQHPCP